MKRLVSLLIILCAVLYVGSYYQWIKVPTPKQPFEVPQPEQTLRITSEDSAVTTAVEKSLPSVVTISIKKTTQARDTVRINPLNPFSPFETIPGTPQEVEGNIGSGFIIKSDGLIVTNKHVVSDEEATYTVIASDDKEYPVKQISRDPLNDLAILKIEAKDLKALTFGDSTKLKLGQTVIAMGTPLGEFRNSVTKGIISGLGRGITAGSEFDQSAER
ncbi:MAG: putative periplasmic serine endoprotease DegP-like precursor [Microgenomates bacterium OLB22]|nr:MAG: putative periplasmic serine endoprotease DegP-like precursor [Microgenomates bacterium OLB22]